MHVKEWKEEEQKEREEKEEAERGNGLLSRAEPRTFKNSG